MALLRTNTVHCNYLLGVGKSAHFMDEKIAYSRSFTVILARYPM